MLAPCSTYSSSGIADPDPAPRSITTSWPRSTNSRTPAGVIATRYSSVLISHGTPILIAVSSLHERRMERDDERRAAKRQASRVHPVENTALDAIDFQILNL